jgi:acyl carrier protein
MPYVRTRLIGCFRAVFPTLPEDSIQGASQATVPAWDSVAAVTLLNVLEDEFGIEVDFDEITNLDSFDKVLQYLDKQVRAS